MTDLKNGEIIVKKRDLVELKRNIQSLLTIRDEIQKARDVHNLFKEIKRINEMDFDQTIMSGFTEQINDLKVIIYFSRVYY